jgi:hypothetical protein
MESSFISTLFPLNELKGKCISLFETNSIVGFDLTYYKVQDILKLINELNDMADTVVFYPSKTEFSIYDSDIQASDNDERLYLLNTIKFI